MTKRGLILSGVYVSMWLVSNLVRCARSDEGPLPEGAQRRIVPEMRGGEVRGGQVQMAFRDVRPPAVPDPPVLVLLHGSPAASASFNRLLPLLGDRFRLIVPDFPGFGGSTLKVADYSAKAHAHQIVALLDSLGIERAHLFGYSMGGGVALEMSAMANATARWQSLVLVSSIGVQELELLGDYMLNHAVHGLQLAGLWLAQESIPHFGWMDRAMLNAAYARNFFDTDQRPYREWLKALEMPTLIIHGTADFLVPFAAAQEHRRLVPQSEWQALEKEGHMLVITEPEKITPGVIDFIDRVEAGAALQRPQADPSRVALAAEPFEQHRPKRDSWKALLFMMALLALATFVSEDFACIGAGLLVSKGVIGFVPATTACFLGIFIGDIGLYFAGRWMGRAALTRAPFKWVLHPGRVEASAQFFEKQGAILIFTSRFVPGTRLPTYFGAGMFQAPLKVFAFWFLVAAVIWTPALVALAWLIGGSLLHWFGVFEDYALRAVLGAVFLLWLLLKVAVPSCSWKGRRLLLGKWRRRTRWEFWPMWVFYPPVILGILYLGFRHRCLTLFTAANPGIPDGGVVLESKSRILDQFGGHPAIAPYLVLEATAMSAEAIAAELTARGLALPLVMKPDVGERGAGVKIVRSWEAAAAYLLQARDPVIAQEYVGGIEFGVFYSRLPGEAKGEIISITDKRLIGVYGDGRRTVEALILADDRAVCMANFFMDQLGPELTRIPADGERVPLTEVGTHCRGALFLDGAQHGTEALRAWIDHLSQRFEGFYFGRYDLRVPSVDALQGGENIKVLELNGVTSEATHIYDPANGLFSAYRTLFRQWKRAFEIGARNAAHGAPVTGIRALLKLYLQYKDRGN